MSINTIKKALIGIQDLLIGTGTKAQTRNGTAYNIERLDLIKPVDTLADLKALPVNDVDRMYSKVLLLGSVTKGDSLGGMFYWDATSEAVSDDVTIIASTGVAVGRWLLLIGNTSIQTWQNVAGARAVATDYTNDTGKPIEVIVTVSSITVGADVSILVGIDAVPVLQTTGNASADAAYATANFTVPNGSNYNVTVGAGDFVLLWSELR